MITRVTTCNHDPLKHYIDCDGCALEKIKKLEAKVKTKDKEIEELRIVVKDLNPCGHTGFESASCGVCGYPDSRKLIAHLEAKLSRLTAALKDDERAEKIIESYRAYERYRWMLKAITDYRTEILKELQQQHQDSGNYRTDPERSGMSSKP